MSDDAVRVEVFSEPGGHTLSYAIDGSGAVRWVRFDDEDVPPEALTLSGTLAQLEAQAAARRGGK